LTHVQTNEITDTDTVTTDKITDTVIDTDILHSCQNDKDTRQDTGTKVRREHTCTQTQSQTQT